MRTTLRKSLRPSLERIVQASSKPGNVVLDPFSGTFTTSAVARRLGRTTIGVERELEYVKIGLRRLGIQQEFDGEPLEPPDKTYIRTNGKRPQQTANDEQRTLFLGEG